MQTQLTQNFKQYKYLKTNRNILLLIMLMSVCQQLPIIREALYSQMRLSLYLLFVILSFRSIHIFKTIYKIAFFRYFIYVLFYSLFINIFTVIYSLDTSPFLNMMIPFGILVCSFNIDFSDEQYENLLFSYCIIVTVLALSSVLYYAGSFTIQAIYVIPAKNQLGPMLGIILVILGRCLLKYREYNILKNTINIFMFIAIFSSLLVLRNRSGIVSGLIVLFLYFVFNYKISLKKNSLIIFFSISIVFIGVGFSSVGETVTEFVWESMTLNYDVTDLDSISSGRVDKYIEAIEFSKDHFITGNLTNTLFSFYGNPHNYILFNWVKYGIVFSMPLVLLYIYMYIYVIKSILFNRNGKYDSLSIWILFFSLLVSNFEYSYPYGPGVSQLMLWILMGQYLKRDYYNKIGVLL